MATNFESEPKDVLSWERLQYYHELLMEYLKKKQGIMFIGSFESIESIPADTSRVAGSIAEITTSFVLDSKRWNAGTCVIWDGTAWKSISNEVDPALLQWRTDLDEFDNYLVTANALSANDTLFWISCNDFGIVKYFDGIYQIYSSAQVPALSVNSDGKLYCNTKVNNAYPFELFILNNTSGTFTLETGNVANTKGTSDSIVYTSDTEPIVTNPFAQIQAAATTDISDAMADSTFYSVSSGTTDNIYFTSSGRARVLLYIASGKALETMSINGTVYNVKDNVGAFYIYCYPNITTPDIFQAKYNLNADNKNIYFYIDTVGNKVAFDTTFNLSDLNAAIVRNTANIATNTANIAQNTTDITSLKQSIGGDLTELQEQVATNTANIAGNTTNITQNTADIAGLKTDVAENTTDIATNTTDISALKNRVTVNEGNIATNTSKISDNSTDITTLQSRVSVNETNITNLETTVTDNTTDISALKTDVTTNTANIAANTTDITALKTQVATNKADIAANTTNITENSTDITNLETRVTANETNITTNTKGIATNAASIASLTSSKQDKLTFDTTPTASSTNPVTSEGIKSYVDTEISSLPAAYHPKGSVTFANIPTTGLTEGDVYNITNSFTIDSRFVDYVEGETKTYPAGTNIAYTSDGKWDAQCGLVDLTSYQKTANLTSADGSVTISTTAAGVADFSVAQLTFDTTPINGSTNPVTSDGIYDALATKQGVLTFDTIPALNSDSPVTSNGIYLWTKMMYVTSEYAVNNYQRILTFDDSPSIASTNPVTSKGIYTAIYAKQDKLTFDTTPTDGSTNPVTSDGIYDALATKQGVLTFDAYPTAGSTNPVTSKGILSFGSQYRLVSDWTGTVTKDSTTPVSSGGVYTALTAKQDKLTFDTTPTDGSTNPVTSDGIYDKFATVNTTITNGFSSLTASIAEKQDKLTFDTTPKDGSTNPVTSDGIYEYVKSILPQSLEINSSNYADYTENFSSSTEEPYVFKFINVPAGVTSIMVNYPTSGLCCVAGVSSSGTFENGHSIKLICGSPDSIKIYPFEYNNSAWFNNETDDFIHYVSSSDGVGFKSWAIGWYRYIEIVYWNKKWYIPTYSYFVRTN